MVDQLDNNSVPQVRKSAAYNVRTTLRGSCFMKTCITSRARVEEDVEDEGETMAEDADEKRRAREEALKTEDIHPASDLVGDFVAQKLKELKEARGSKAGSSKSVVHMLVFVRQVPTLVICP